MADPQKRNIPDNSSQAADSESVMRKILKAIGIPPIMADFAGMMLDQNQNQNLDTEEAEVLRSKIIKRLDSLSPEKKAYILETINEVRPVNPIRDKKGKIPLLGLGIDNETAAKLLLTVHDQVKPRFVSIYDDPNVPKLAEAAHSEVKEVAKIIPKKVRQTVVTATSVSIQPGAGKPEAKDLGFGVD